MLWRDVVFVAVPGLSSAVCFGCLAPSAFLVSFCIVVGLSLLGPCLPWTGL